METTPINVNFSSAAPKGTSRDQGRVARQWLKGLVEFHKQVLLGLDGVEVLTPSFADECFGKLLVEMGEEDFRNRLQITGGTPEVRKLINQVLRIRLQELRK